MAIYDFLEMTSMLSTHDREAMRDGVPAKRTLDQRHRSQTSHIKSDSLSHHRHNRPYESMSARVFEGEHDLLIKATHKHASLGSVINADRLALT